MAQPERPAAAECIAGRYQIEELLGRGGMAAVYRVRDQRSGRLLALKRAWATDVRKAQRRAALLEREYHTLAQLAHPRIIEVYEYGVDDKGPYYTMELLAGNDLDKHGRMQWKQACELLYDVASSLAILHARGLLHRDISFRNVRSTPEGRAKLIDFGAMATMGVVKDIVGTPPFVAPEVMQMQELDGRADLYSLGALGYFVLTGRNAFPARRLNELRDIWRSRPAAPARLVPEVPAQLSALIMELLMLDRGARPKSAAEVMERLSGLAGLTMDEHVAVSRAYLTTPALVGRDAELVSARRHILSLARRDGGSLLIEGDAGSGRSRMLDACVLEGKLLGAAVLRADASDGAEGDWGVARTICNQLIELLPKEAAEASRLSRDVLGHVVEGLQGEGSLSSVTPERSLVLRELRDFVFSLSRSQRLMLVVDDIDKIDEPSAALLAALANKTERHAVMIVLSVERSADPAESASLRLLRLVAKSIALNPLDAGQTDALIRSIFGDVPNLQLVAGRIHALAQGNPRATMDLAQHLVERGLARYEAGSWLLPSHLDEGDLPQTLADALAARLAPLGEDARALIDVLCVADGDVLALRDYPQLTRIVDHKRVFSALDELLAARLLVAEGEGYRFSQRSFLKVLQQGMPEEQRRILHGRIAELLAQSGGEVVRRAHHLLQADRDREAIELLCTIDLQAALPPVALLKRAVEQAERCGFALRTQHQLRSALLSKASIVLDPSSFRACLPSVLAQLEQDSGLAIYRELADVPEKERLKQALASAQERHQAKPEAERVYAVMDAIRELARVCGALCSYAMQLFDLESLEALPSLAPLAPLSPALSVVGSIVEAGKHWIRGRHMMHRELVGRILQGIEGPERGGLDEAQYRRTRAGLNYAAGLFEASLGITAVETRAQTLEAEREHRVNAWRIRMLLHLNQGDVDDARKCERRAELLQLQDGGQQSYLGMGSGFEVMALAEAGDLLGVKSCLDKITMIAERYPAWRPWIGYGQCRYRWLQGDLQGALDALLPALEQAPAGRHNVFGSIAGLHVRVLSELGRHDEAVASGRKYLELMRREQLAAPDHGIAIGLAHALAARGDHQEALSTIEPVIESAERVGSAGLALGVLYETRARIAIRMRDTDALARYAELCGAEFKKARNPALSARLARMFDEANQQEGEHFDAPLELRELMAAETETETGYNTVHSRIMECVDDSDRARCALTLLLQSTDSGTGYLYGVRKGRAVLLAALPEAPADEALDRWVEERMESELAASESATVDAFADETRTDANPPYSDAEGRCMEPTFLFANRAHEQWLAAILVLHLPTGPRTLPSKALLEEIANELIEHGDVDGIRADDPVTR
jgi:tetratricopeptide (TPR) repeat protein